MTATLVPAKTRTANTNFSVAKPKWNRTTTANNHQNSSNVSKILVFAAPRKSLGQLKEVSNTKDKNGNINNSGNQPEWTDEKKSVFPVSLKPCTDFPTSYMFY